ncbi:MAG: flagellar basal body L-ring protein FlgH [Deltaproteobacteria bacterium]|nr:MAG: flagellar basal body L-ring protein FlgH [Deltaproteobacteria bacterium]
MKHRALPRSALDMLEWLGTILTAATVAAIAAAAAVALLTGCASHIAPYHAKHRTLDPGAFGARSRASGGSLYAEGTPGLFEDHSASRIGDILVIKIDEKDVASHQADTQLNKSDATSYGLPAAIGLVSALKSRYPDLDPAKLFSSTTDQKFSGNGQVKREGTVTAILPVRVGQILPSGDLFVEGTKVVMVGAEEHHIYVSGIVRRVDIADDDSVPSSRIADAEIEYTGRGDISDTQRRGWLARTLSKLWPF